MTIYNPKKPPFWDTGSGPRAEWQRSRDLGEARERLLELEDELVMIRLTVTKAKAVCRRDDPRVRFSIRRQREIEAEMMEMLERING